MANKGLTIPEIEKELRSIDRSLGVRMGDVYDSHSPINRTHTLEIYDKRSTYKNNEYVHYDIPICHVNARNGFVYDDTHNHSIENQSILKIVKLWDRKIPD